MKIFVRILVMAVAAMALGAPCLHALPGDADSSGRVDGRDLIKLGLAWDSANSGDRWNPDADFDGDGAVGAQDLAILTGNFAKTGISFGLWAGTASGTERIHKFTKNGRRVLSKGGISNPVWITPAADGHAVWVVDSAAGALIKLSNMDASILLTVSGLINPRSADVDASDGAVWVADTGSQRIIKLLPGISGDYDADTSSGFHIAIDGFNAPWSVSVDPENHCVWVADIGASRVIRLDADVADGYDIGEDVGSHDIISGFTSPKSVSVDAGDGSVWVADTGNSQVVRLSGDDHTELLRVGGYVSPGPVRANPMDHSVWVVDHGSDGRILRLGAAGAILGEYTGLSEPATLAVNSGDGSCWTHDSEGAGEIVYLSPGGSAVLRAGAFNDIQCMALVPDEALPGKSPTATGSISDVMINVGGTVTLTGTGFDPDGSIVKCEWDYDGDGIFDEYKDFTEPPYIYAIEPPPYLDAGIYNPVFRVTDNNYFTATDYSLVLHVGLLGLSVAVSGDQENAPLDVTLTAVVTGVAPGNAVALYEWDVDGDGNADYTGPALSEIIHQYTLSGDWDVSLTITDALGNQASGGATATVLNASPTAYNNATPISGAAPLTVQLAGAATDSDGVIVKYEWDYDVDGEDDWSSETTGFTEFTYESAGTYETRFTATDNGGLTDSATRIITVTESRIPPTAAASADAAEGYAPFVVNFTGEGRDPDHGTISLYEWDFDGDGVFDHSSGATGDISHTYATPGLFNAIFRVTDGDSLAAEDSLLITVKAGGTPTAVADATPESGDVPLAVAFNAEGSTDPGGQIVLYEWIFGLPDFFVVDNGNDVVRKYNDAAETTFSGFSGPYWAAVDPRNGSVWVTDTSNDQVVKLAADGSGEAFRVHGLNDPLGLAVAPSDGSVWVVDSMNDQVVKLSDQGAELSRTGGFDFPGGLSEDLPHGLSVDSRDEAVWVADYHNGQVVKLAADGTEQVRVSGFSQPTWVAVDQTDGSVWVADYGNNRIVKLNPDVPDGYHTDLVYAPDSSPAGHQSEVVGDVAEVDGRLSGGFDMGGYYDYIRIPSDPVLDVQNLTVEVWIRPDSAAGAIFMRGNVSGENELFVGISSPDTVKVILDQTETVYFTDPAINFVDDSFHHIAVVHDAGMDTLTCYVDGARVGDVKPVSVTLDFGGSDALIGADFNAYNANPGNFFYGVIDDVRVWNTVRSQNDISTGMDSALGGAENGLVGYWTCNSLETDAYHTSLGQLSGPAHIAVHPLDQSVWVTEYNGGRIAQAAKGGDRIITRIGGFSRPFSTYIQPDGEAIWVADALADSVVVVSGDGTVQRTITGLDHPTAVDGFLPADNYFSSDENGNTTHTYSAAGIYNAVLKVTDSDGNSDSDTVVIRADTPSE